jgi:spoIIIJ-associated protein
MSDKEDRQPQVDALQGDGEEQTEAYTKYDEGAPESATQQSANSSSGVSGSADEQADAVRLAMEDSITFAKKYLEDLLSFFGLNTDVRATNSEDEVIELNVPSTHLNGFLIGQRGETMHAMQFLVSSALKSNGFEVTRVNVDVAEYKHQRANRLANQAEEWVKEVKKSGKTMELNPMNAADRRTVHKVANEHGVSTESVGEGRDRHIVLKPGTDNESEPEIEAETDIDQ